MFCASSTQALAADPTIKAYESLNCNERGSQPHTVCPGMPSNSCCKFPSRARTSSVGWNFIGECDVAAWFWPNQRAPGSPDSEAAHCGTVRDSVGGDSQNVCMIARGVGGANNHRFGDMAPSPNALANDGAMW